MNTRKYHVLVYENWKMRRWNYSRNGWRGYKGQW
jgi:hypothetical protein